jgi:hypothetical protein
MRSSNFTHSAWFSKPFDLQETRKRLEGELGVKGLDERCNLSRCLEDILHVNTLFAELERRRELPFHEEDSQHTEVLKKVKRLPNWRRM